MQKALRVKLNGDEFRNNASVSFTLPNRGYFSTEMAPEPEPKEPRSAKMSVEVPTMTTPASAIKDEVRVLIDVQIATFGQPTPLHLLNSANFTTAQKQSGCFAKN